MAPLLVRGFFGDAYAPAITVARILLLAGVVLSVNRVAGSVLKAIGRPFDAGIAELMGLGATVVLLGIFIPTLGLNGRSGRFTRCVFGLDDLAGAPAESSPAWQHARQKPFSHYRR